jgi:hypothetical protein
LLEEFEINAADVSFGDEVKRRGSGVVVDGCSLAHGDFTVYSRPCSEFTHRCSMRMHDIPEL